LADPIDSARHRESSGEGNRAERRPLTSTAGREILTPLDRKNPQTSLATPHGQAIAADEQSAFDSSLVQPVCGLGGHHLRIHQSASERGLRSGPRAKRAWRYPMEIGRVLFVDDDKEALEAYKRLLHGVFDVETAMDSNQAFAAIQVFGPFEVVISDMKMTGMDGAEFLAMVRQLAPNSVRMVLSGHKDIDHAIQAVNEGRIFRYLTKPCGKDELIRAIELARAYYRTRTEEKRLAKQAKEIKSRADSFNRILLPHDLQ
jgi:FixJ family two-component response regulator